MKRIVAFVKRDAQKVTSNAISLVVCMGLIIIPSLYAWFNIEASWDPYSNTQNLKVAVANCDEGYTSDLLPMEINAGDATLAALREKNNINYVFVDETEAREGIQAGRYYASLIIPKTFSRDLMTLMSDDIKPAHIIYLNNEKENSIATLVTDKASVAVKNEVDSAFTGAVTEIVTKTLSNLSTYMESDQVVAFAGKLTGALRSAATHTSHAAQAVRDYQSLIRSLKKVITSSDELLDGSLRVAESASSDLKTIGGGLKSSAQGIADAAQSANQSSQKVATSFDAVQKDIDKAFELAQKDAELSSSLLQNSASTLEHQLKPFKDLQTSLSKHNVSVPSLDAAVSEMESLAADLTKAAQSLTTHTKDALASKAKLTQKIADARTSVKTIQSSYKDDLSAALSKLSTSLNSTTQDSQELVDSIKKTCSTLKETGVLAARDLDSIDQALGKAADTLDSTANQLSKTTDALIAAKDSGSIQKIKTILSADSVDLARFMAGPVHIERKAVWPIENNGSAMAPFYTTLSLWVGATILVALVKVNPSEEALKEIADSKNYEQYFGRLVFFVVIGFLQATLVGLGDLFYLNIQCVHPWLFMGSVWLTSFVFVNIIYALTVSFGDVGKAIAVLLLVMQVAGSGGSFPMEMLPRFFQSVYPYLPFVSAMGALRACIAGIYGNELIQTLGHLLLFCAPALFLGLILKKPVARLNEWIEHNLNKTKFM